MYSKTKAALIILKDYGKPLHIREIIRIALAKKMIEVKGKTPWSTLGADFYNENKRKIKKGKKLRFIHLDAGIWGLAEWNLKPVERKTKVTKKSKP